MSYTIECADAVIRTVGKFRTLNNYQLAGHIANAEFWVCEVRHAMQVIASYSRRDSDRKKAERVYINTHDTKRFSALEKDRFNEFEDEEFLLPAEPDNFGIEASELRAKRQEVADALYHFLKRCHKESLLTGRDAKRYLKDCELGWEPGDFAETS